ncbi:uncharacterized protein Tco025E_09165 [Trypanosoma conorhini]|uniref:PSP1 C-terminal domain-containing protein n=1 Tax=Trypanosoma conorhini TaxID=83891 RepID=A0A3R7RAE6_9TRYP|nr:uncharacterized protein Tco025E_09165 [Trypanosoma conorhini]RNE98789.1 hypothetical protein Tco025E_09165 [Trypanosoma conorhini]
MRQVQGGLNEQGPSGGPTSGTLNFFLASGERHPQSYADRMKGRPVGPHQPASVPVYAPSKTPRLLQFVDMTTNKAGITPFFSLNSDTADAGGNNPVEDTEEDAEGEEAKTHACMHPLQGRETKEEPRVMENQALQACLAMNTPMQQKQSVHVAFGTNTPSSAMGMTLSPATAVRSVVQTTPSTVARSNVHAGTVSQRIQRNLNAVTMLGGSSSLATELESAFAEHNKKRHPGAKPNHQEEVETSLCTADTDTTQSMGCAPPDTKPQRRPDAERMDSSTQRRNKEKRRGKSKNNSQPPLQRQNINANNKTTNRAGPASPALQEEILPTKDNKKYSLRLQCHGNHTNTAFSGKEFHVGDHVIFEADRGVDLGQVVHCEDTTKESSSLASDADAAAGGTGAKDGGHGPAAHVVRCATPEEVEDWKGNLVAKEAEAVAECSAACEDLGLAIHVSDAAFQFDRQKLIFLYETDERVDFRSLLQVMFSKFRCRIWMERTNAAS